jgi:hypothetical protein
MVVTALLKVSPMAPAYYVAGLWAWAWLSRTCSTSAVNADPTCLSALWSFPL